MLLKRKKANPLLDTSQNIELTPRQEKIRKITKNITRFLKKYGRLMIGGSILAVVVFCAVFAPFLTDQDPTLVVLRNSKLLPNAEHPLGCDYYGRDIWARLLDRRARRTARFNRSRCCVRPALRILSQGRKNPDAYP